MAKQKPIVLPEAEYAYATENYIGFCLACGEERECTEPDACKYPCESCGARKVYGAEELLLMGLIEFSEDVDRDPPNACDCGGTFRIAAGDAARVCDRCGGVPC